MLINFRFKNCRSFYDEANLSMEAIKDNELKEINTFSIDERLMNKGDNELLKGAVIFGGNASGKSNVIKALAYMKNVLAFSASQIPVVQKNETFEFFVEAKSEASLYEVEIIQNSAYYKYGFEIKDGIVLSEWLDRRIERVTSVFKRVGNEIEIPGLSKQVAKLINVPSKTLFLSVGNNFNLSISNYLQDVINWFQNLFIVFENRENSLELYSIDGGKYREQALKILELADIGIKDISVKKDKVVNMEEPSDIIKLNMQLPINPTMFQGQIKKEENNLYNIDLKTSFNVYDKDGKVNGQKEIMLFKDAGFNSEGTVRLLCYIGWILAALDLGRVIFIDEIDSKLHFLVADYLIKLFNSIDKNPNNAQLVCTAHNVMLMDEDLRRDQIYFTSKNEFCESSLVSLSDYKNVRKANLFSKRYLAGFYSKLPDMTESL